MKRKSYYKQLQDPRWQKKSAEIKERDGWKCRHCEDATKQLSVHHSFYTRNTYLWDYPDWSLKCLCGDCHEEAQNQMEAAQEAMARLGLELPISLFYRSDAQTGSHLGSLLMDIADPEPDKQACLIIAASEAVKSTSSAWFAAYSKGIQDSKP